MSAKTESPSFSDTIGREHEKSLLLACLRAGRHVLLEGPVGVGKTHLASQVAKDLGRPVFRVDGDARMGEQKLTGWFDPPSVLKNGFQPESFMQGPLVAAMRAGGILFLNELNRLPEGTQNVLLPSLDEKRLLVPKLGEVFAEPGFVVIATQNPKEFIATSALSEALLDRFELILVDYQSEPEEIEIVTEHLKRHNSNLKSPLKNDVLESIARAATLVCRKTRGHPKVRRGASIRAALSIADLTAELLRTSSFEEAFSHALRLALPNRIELQRDLETPTSMQEIWNELIADLTATTKPAPEKKK